MKRIGVVVLSLLVGSFGVSVQALKTIRSDFDFFKPVAEFNVDAAAGDLKDAYPGILNTYNPFAKNYFYPLPVYGALYWIRADVFQPSIPKNEQKAFLKTYGLKSDVTDDLSYKAARYFIPKGLFAWLDCKEGMGTQVRINKYLNFVAGQILRTCLVEDPRRPFADDCPLKLGNDEIPIYGFDFKYYGYDDASVGDPSPEQLLTLIDVPQLLLNKKIKKLLSLSLFGTLGISFRDLCTKFEKELPALIKTVFVEIIKEPDYEKRREKVLLLHELVDLLKKENHSTSKGFTLGVDIENSLDLVDGASETEGLLAFLDTPGLFLEDHTDPEKVIAFKRDPKGAIRDEKSLFEGIIVAKKELLSPSFNDLVDQLVAAVGTTVDTYLNEQSEVLEKKKNKWLQQKEDQEKIERNLREKATHLLGKASKMNDSLGALTGALDELAKKLNGGENA